MQLFTDCNNIGKEGAIAFGETLKINLTLLNLELSKIIYNHIKIL